MTDWRSIMDSQKCSPHPHYPQNTQNRTAQGTFEDAEYIEDSKSRPSNCDARPPGEGPCPDCGGRVWFLNSNGTGPLQCRRCVSSDSEKWKELVYVPEGWRPRKAGEPEVKFQCSGCQKAVPALWYQQSGPWVCHACAWRGHPPPISKLGCADPLTSL